MQVIFLSVFFLAANCQVPIPVHNPNNVLITCVTGVVEKYFKQYKQVMYVDLDVGQHHDILRSIHKTNITSVFKKTPPQIITRDMNLRVIPHLAYVVIASDVEEFMNHIFALIRDPNWNPYARFLIVIKSFQMFELRPVFDTLLNIHVNYVVVANGTSAAELYTYNPFDKYACGKYYTEITELGKCLDVTENIYPKKVVTGLRKCSFNVSVPHWPPFSINPRKVRRGKKTMGIDQYIFHLISEIEQFQYKINYNYDAESFSYVTNNMSLSGPLSMILANKTDVMLGGLLLIPSRANMLFPLFGHLDQVDEIRFMVRKSRHHPAWKDFYLEFTSDVWALLLLALICYSALVAILLRKGDKGIVVLTLLDNLLAHGRNFNCRQSVKLVFIVWVWSAYLVNSFYLTSLMSLTTKPGVAYQIADEEAVKAHKLQPCLSKVMDTYRKTESNHGDLLNDINTNIHGCQKLLGSIRAVGKSDQLYTIVMYSVYLYNRQKFSDEYGVSTVYSFKLPYAKCIYAMYFYKGFPMYERLHKLALRIRETGLSEKGLNDHYYDQNIRYHYHSRGYVSRFAIPWYVYIVGIFISSITFVVEVASRYKTKTALHVASE